MGCCWSSYTKVFPLTAATADVDWAENAFHQPSRVSRVTLPIPKQQQVQLGFEALG